MKKIMLFLLIFCIPFCVKAEDSFLLRTKDHKEFFYQDEIIVDNMFEQLENFSSVLDINAKFDTTSNPDCSEIYGGGLGEWIKNFFTFVKYVGLGLVVVLTTMDFLKVVAGDKDDGIKNAFGRFVKRCIAVFLLFLTPVLIDFVFDLMGGSLGNGNDACTEYIET